MKKSGWLIGIAAMGMMLGLLSGDIAALDKFSDAFYPSFIAGVMQHIASVIGAFVGGNLIPNMFANKAEANSAAREELAKL